MCEYGITTNIEVTIPADLSHTKQAIKRIKPIDSCIAPIVGALEKRQILMRGSCCGHGKNDGVILLEDGRELVIKIGAL